MIVFSYVELLSGFGQPAECELRRAGTRLAMCSSSNIELFSCRHITKENHRPRKTSHSLKIFNGKEKRERYLL
jgi:hypothetical protein